MFLYFYQDSILAWLVKRWVAICAIYTAWMSIFYFFVPIVGFYAPIAIGLTLPIMIITAAYGLGSHRLKYEISYGMYLYHVVVINALIQTGNTDGIKAIFIVVPAAVALGYVENIMIDKPISKIRIR